MSLFASIIIDYVVSVIFFEDYYFYVALQIVELHISHITMSKFDCPIVGLNKGLNSRITK